MISSRFAPIVCVLLALALVPTIIHSYADSRVLDGRTAQAIPAVLAGYSSVPSGRGANWGERKFESEDWIERIYTRGSDRVTLTVARTYDPKSVYHHPELAVAYGTSFARRQVTWLPQRPAIPVHVLYTERGDLPAALYALHYGGRFVANPILFQLRTAGELLFSGRKPMTLFFAADLSGRPSADLDGLPAAELLFAAMESFVGAGDSE